ncbi:hypothetical protein HNO88_004224 [Novosphingobium chloroacetimidivorans]|uniref:Uncharacterized protein n=1 Tax=Novosphingobium chloroacetimidivorans TaxID=1428314 RepID=A0A7W7KES4_9SPHN|nr:hypothetical protein [Novosphingobium chloroacetimidivorans]MBB4860878.1 hypothetical protein [Novosphingobium chloroacetimidivorans]
MKLQDHLYFNVKDWEARCVHARLRKAETLWPGDFALQAFLLLEAHEISGTTIHTGLGDLNIRNRVQHTGIIRAKVEPLSSISVLCKCLFLYGPLFAGARSSSRSTWAAAPSGFAG